MRAIWSGSINFLMVSIPAKLYTATDDKKVSFHQYHRDCGSRIQMPKWCPVCVEGVNVTPGRKVEAAEIQRGYELSKTEHIILEEQDFASLPLKSLKQIQIVEFVSATEIDIRAIADCYYLSCEDAGLKAFTLFLKAMEQANLVGIARLTYRDREHLSVVKPFDGIMLLQTLHYADEIKPYEELKHTQLAMMTDQEVELALNLIKAMSAKFDHGKYHDDYREALERLVQAKVAGEVLTPISAEAPTSNLTDALMRSIEQATRVPVGKPATISCDATPYST